MRHITIVNRSSLVNRADLVAACLACQTQLHRDFAPAYGGLFALLAYIDYPLSGAAAGRVETITLLDDCDQAEALGFHTVSDAREPQGYVFVRCTIDAGLDWQPTLSHELMEQLADPWCDGYRLGAYQGEQAAVAYEVADPVEADSYLCCGVPVSNFVLPAWFRDDAKAGTQVDFLKRLSAPLTCTAGGYVSFSRDLATWSNDVQGRMRPHRQAAHRLSRHGRRDRRRGNAA